MTVGFDAKVAEDLKHQLLKNLHSIIQRFAAFIYSLSVEVEKKGVAVHNLRLFLRSLPIYDYSCEQPNISYLSDDVMVELEKAESIADIFTVLGNYFSYLNYGIYQSILQKFCCDQINDDLKYAEEFKKYIEKHNVKEFVKTDPKLEKYCTEESSELIIKLDLEHTTKLAKIVNVKACIATMLGLQSHVLHIVKIEEGCVKVTVRFPTHVAEVLFHHCTIFTTQQIEGFKNLSVLWLQCNGYTFNAKNDYLPVATSLSVSHACMQANSYSSMFC